MRRFLVIASVSLSICLAGCESHQAKVDKLQKDYDDAVAKFKMDCSAEYLKIPPTLSPKCAEEDRERTEAWKRLQDERAKK
jgi:hypothetical protein